MCAIVQSRGTGFGSTLEAHMETFFYIFGSALIAGITCVLAMIYGEVHQIRKVLEKK